MTTTRTCPDCKTPLTKIQVIDRLGGTTAESGLIFLDAQASTKVSVWSGNVINRQGRVHGHLCNDCQRVLFYAEMEGGG